jgi:hypothetical protein
MRRLSIGIDTAWLPDDRRVCALEHWRPLAPELPLMKSSKPLPKTPGPVETVGST